jgi:hypothetical protein
MDNNLAIILLPLIVMIIVYSFVLGVSVKRCLKLVFEKNKSVFYGKIFYANIFILCIIRIALYLVLIFKFDDSNDDINDN